jgi:hypothetical protein
MNISFPWFGKTYIKITTRKSPVPLRVLHKSPVRILRFFLDEAGDVCYAEQIFPGVLGFGD